MNYATLHQVKEYTGNLGNDADDTRFLEFLKWASRFIDKYKGRRYDVRLATILHDAPIATQSAFGRFDSSMISPASDKQLIIIDDLLEMVELLNGDGTEITSAEYLLNPRTQTPYSVLSLRTGTTWQPDGNGDTRGALSLKGYWGYHPDYSNAFVDSLDTVRDNPLSAGATQIHVSSIAGTAVDLDSPRFQAGQLLRIEDELIFIVSAEAVVDADDILTVARHYNGTTAAQHAQGTVIKVFRPDENIVQACVRLVAWRYHQKDADTFDRTYVAGTGVVNVPSALPADVRTVLGAKGRAR